MISMCQELKINNTSRRREDKYKQEYKAIESILLLRVFKWTGSFIWEEIWSPTHLPI